MPLATRCSQINVSRHQLREVMWQLQSDGRVTYRTLKHLLGLDEGLLDDIRKELSLRRLAVDEAGEVLVWIGETLDLRAAGFQVDERPAALESIPVACVSLDEQTTAPQPLPSMPEAERRQLTVMFCDLVGSTDLAPVWDLALIGTNAQGQAVREVIQMRLPYVTEARQSTPR